MKKLIWIFALVLVSSALLAQTKTEVATTELQKPISEYITKNFSGFSVVQAFKVDTKGVITYDICVSKNKDHEKLFFDKEGKFLRRESCTNECCQDLNKK